MSEDRAASVDALVVKGDVIVFIEFKNGKVNNRNVKDKIRDSLLIFNDITEKNLTYTRNKAELIVVYNEERIRCQISLEKKKCRKLLHGSQ